MPDPTELNPIPVSGISDLKKQDLKKEFVKVKKNEKKSPEEKKRIAKQTAGKIVGGVAKAAATPVPVLKTLIKSAEAIQACVTSVDTLDKLKKYKNQFPCGDCTKCVRKDRNVTYKCCEEALEYMFQKQSWRAVKNFAAFLTLGISKTVHRSVKAMMKKYKGTKGVNRAKHAQNLWFCAVELDCKLAQQGIKILVGSNQKNAMEREQNAWKIIFDKLKSV
jgi:hypothetical protein